MIILYTYNFLMWLFLIGLISEGNAPWRGQKEPRTSLKILPAQVALYIHISVFFMCKCVCAKPASTDPFFVKPVFLSPKRHHADWIVQDCIIMHAAEKTRP